MSKGLTPMRRIEPMLADEIMVNNNNNDLHRRSSARSAFIRSNPGPRGQ